MAPPESPKPATVATVNRLQNDRLGGAINSLDSQGQTGTQASITPEYLLAHLRAARVRAQLAVCEIDSIGLALKSQLIDSDQALAWLEDVDALRFLLAPESEAAA